MYLVPLISALVSNLLSKLYAAVVNRNMKLSSPSHSKFLLSLNNSIAFVIIIAVQISGSYISRIERFYFYYPMVLVFSCDVIPFMIIMRNASMKKRLVEFLTNICQMISETFSFFHLKFRLA